MTAEPKVAACPRCGRRNRVAPAAPGVSRRFEAQAIPTLVMLRGGRVVARQVGAAPANVLWPWPDDALAKQEAS